MKRKIDTALAADSAGTTPGGMALLPRAHHTVTLAVRALPDKSFPGGAGRRHAAATLRTRMWPRLLPSGRASTGAVPQHPEVHRLERRLLP
jgi:hypothetical protein